jgi:hypothetical protein
MTIAMKIDEAIREGLSYKKYESQFGPVSKTTTSRLLEEDANIGKYLDGEDTLKGAVFIECVEDRRRKIRFELARRHALKSLEVVSPTTP